MVSSMVQSSFLRYGLLATIYFLPALLFEYLSSSPTSASLVVPTVLLYVLTFVHQLILGSPAIPYRLPYPIDIGLTFAEVAAYIFFVLRALWAPESCGPYKAFLSLVVFDVTNLAVLVMILFFKITDILMSGNLSRQIRWDFLSGSEWTTTAIEKARQKFNQRISFITLFSRLLVLVMVNFTIGLAWKLIILAPVEETEAIPLRESRAPFLSQGPIPPDMPWSVVIASPPLPVPRNYDWISAVDVTSLSNGSRNPCPLNPNNNFSPPPPSLSVPRPPPGFPLPAAAPANAISYDCPSDIDILVTVNFTALGFSSGTIFNGSMNSVQVMVGGGNTADIIRRTDSPVSLIPGWNMVGFAKPYIRLQFTNPRFSALGLFMSYQPLMIADIINVGPDPQASISPLINRSSDTATMRIIPLNTPGDLRIVEEYRERSVLRGFSTIGGMWTFCGGIFATFFGLPLSLVLFNKKPLSIFGISHLFQKDKIRQGYLDEYPDIESDLQKQGIVRFMVDKYVDMDMFKPSEYATFCGSPNQSCLSFSLTDVSPSNDRMEPGHAPSILEEDSINTRTI